MCIPLRLFFLSLSSFSLSLSLVSAAFHGCRRLVHPPASLMLAFSLHAPPPLSLAAPPLLSPSQAGLECPRHHLFFSTGRASPPSNHPAPRFSPQVPCVTRIAVLKLGFLDAAEESEHLKEGRALELPMWIVQELMEKVRRPDTEAVARVTVTPLVCRRPALYTGSTQAQRFLIPPSPSLIIHYPA